ncbi:hypothetical protein HY643_02620 [Candidatus Woesearchaeota archaeon]|nr:hypothetical protein [Candidatus Woesearchaeota archaeon]
MKQTMIVAIILGVLVVLSAVQAFQLNSLKTKVAESKVSVSSSGSAASTSLGVSGNEKTTSSVPSNIKNLPKMVGGC